MLKKKQSQKASNTEQNFKSQEKQQKKLLEGQAL